LAKHQTSEDHIALLEELSQWIIDQWTTYPRRWIPASLVVDVQQRITERKFHWIAEALKSARASTQDKRKPVSNDADTPAARNEKPTTSDRRAAVDAYLAEASTRSGKRVTRTDFWKAAGYRSRTEFERWQRCDARTTEAACRAFERILREKPHL
jgi:hypothetical protein